MCPKFKKIYKTITHGLNYPHNNPDSGDDALILILLMMQANYIGESEASQVISTQTVSNDRA